MPGDPDGPRYDPSMQPLPPAQAAVIAQALYEAFPPEPAERDPFGSLLVNVDKTPTVEDGEQPWNPDGPLYWNGPAA